MFSFLVVGFASDGHSGPEACEKILREAVSDYYSYRECLPAHVRKKEDFIWHGAKHKTYCSEAIYGMAKAAKKKRTSYIELMRKLYAEYPGDDFSPEEENTITCSGFRHMWGYK